MPNGFIGNAARSFLTSASTALSDAANNTPRGTMHGRNPVPPEQATRGTFRTRIGNSSNIVVDTHTTSEALNMMVRTDDRVSELFFEIATELEDICRSSYIVPRSVPRFLNTCDRVKGCMGRFREATGNAAEGTHRFLREITNIG